MKKVSAEIKLLALFLLPVIIIAGLHHAVTGFTIYNDGIGYYEHLRSLAIDRDVDFLNEWQFYNSSYSKFSSVPRGVNFPQTRTATGKIDNIYLIGSAIMWAPFFFGAHALALLATAAGLNIPADGYSQPYEAAIGAASILYGFLGLVIIYKLCRKWFDRKSSLAAVLATWYGTSLIWFHGVEPSMAHMNSVFLGAAFTYIWHATLGKRTRLQWAMLGAILGLIYLVRQQEILFGLLIGLELLQNLYRKLNIEQLKKTAISGALAAAGATAMLIPQMLVWKSLHGKYIVYSYGATNQYWYWTIPQLLPFFFSPVDGMWKIPLMITGIAGMLILAARLRGVHLYFAAVLIGEILVTAAWSGWNVGYGFRFLLGMSAFIALGNAELISRAIKKTNAKAVYAVLALLVAANFANMLLFLIGEVSSKVAVADIPAMLTRAIA